MNSSAFSWEEDFPPAYSHTSVSYLKRCLGYEEAKTGNFDAAMMVVCQCAKNERVHRLIEKYPDAILLPVQTKNKLPVALAVYIGLPIYYDVICVNSISRKGLTAMERLLHQPEFRGAIPINKTFIIVDDVVTQGGTVAGLRKHIISNGGYVAAITTLAFAIGSRAIAPKKSNLVLLFLKFGVSISLFLKEANIAEDVNHLTNSQVKYLLRFSHIRNIKLRAEYFYISNPHLFLNFKSQQLIEVV